MKVFEENKSICGGIAEQVKQSISAERVGMAISILRDRIYSDKFKATLFETLSNALDEHVKYGIKRPVSIHLTKMNFLFVILLEVLVKKILFKFSFNILNLPRIKKIHPLEDLESGLRLLRHIQAFIW